MSSRLNPLEVVSGIPPSADDCSRCAPCARGFGDSRSTQPRSQVGAELFRRLQTNTHGASFVEYLALVSVVAFGAAGARELYSAGMGENASLAADRVGALFAGRESGKSPLASGADALIRLFSTQKVGSTKNDAPGGPDSLGTGTLSRDLGEIRRILGAGQSEGRDKYGNPLADDANNRFGNVSRDDLLRINQLLAGLTPRERSYVISQLSDEQLRHWADQTDKFIGGLGGEQHRELMNLLAQGLDGAQASRIEKTFTEDYQRELLADALVHQTTGEQQLDIIKTAAQQGLLQKDPFLAAAVGKMLGAPDPRAPREEGELVPGQKPKDYGSTFAALSSRDVTAILNAITNDPLNGGIHGGEFGYDLQGNGARFLESANRVTDYEVRKKVFEGAAAQLAQVGSATLNAEESSGEFGGRRAVLAGAADLLVPPEFQSQEKPTKEQGVALSQQLTHQLHGDAAFSEAYTSFAKETIRSGHQETLNVVLEPVELAAIPRDGKGGDTGASHLLGEIVGRQNYAATQLQAEQGGTNEVVLSSAVAGGAEALPLLFASEGASAGAAVVAATVQELGPLLYPQYSASPQAGSVIPKGASENVEQLRDAFGAGYLQGNNNF